MTTGIDLNVIGYRWKGEYNSGLTYINGDVVQKDGYSQTYYNGVWSNFIPSQQVATAYGQLLVSGGGVSGIDGEVLQVESGTPDFAPLGDHQGSIVIALPEVGRQGNTRTVAWASCLMNDNSIRTWGYNLYYQLGAGPGPTRKNPQKPPFPAGVKIAKVIMNWSACFAIDTTGRLWSWGEDANYATGQPAGTGPYSTPRLLNGVGDIPVNAVITDVFVTPDWNGYWSTAALASNGRCYVWGYNSQGKLGIGDTIDRQTPVLLPLSTTVPMKYVAYMNSPYGAGYYVSQAGQLYTCGETTISLQGGGGDILYPRLLSWLGTKTVKLVHATQGDFHGTPPAEYLHQVTIVCDDGTLYQAGDNYNSYGLWGTGYTGAMWPGNALFPYITNTNVADAYSFDGGYGRSMILKNDGTVWWSGYNGYYIGREVAPADTSTWVQVAPSVLTNVVKLRFMAGFYGTWCTALRADGKVVSWGINSAGQCGRGTYTESLGADNTTYPPYVLLDKTIVDFAMVGYAYGGLDNAALMLLTDQGELYMCGSQDQYINGDYTNNSTNSPRKIHF